MIPFHNAATVSTEEASDGPDRWSVVPAGLALVAALALGVYLVVGVGGPAGGLSPAQSAVVAALVGAAGVGLAAALRGDRRVVFGTGVAAAVAGAVPVAVAPQAWVVALLLLLSATLLLPETGSPNPRARLVVAVFVLAALAGLLLVSYRAAGAYRVPVGALLVVLLGGAMLSVSGALSGHRTGPDPD